MSIAVKVSQRDANRLYRLFADVERHTNKEVSDLIRQTFVFATQSATHATKPRKGRNKAGNINGGGLRKKDMKRPLVNIPDSMGHWYYQEGKYKPFEVKRKLTRAEVKKKGLKRVTKAVKIWSKKENGWKYLPFPGTKATNNRIFDIPHAGLAKAGWWRGLSKHSGKNRVRNDLNFVKRNSSIPGINRFKVTPYSMTVWNNVKYAPKSSPGAALYGLNKAKNRMVKLYQPKVEQSIQRKIDRGII